MKVFLSGFKRYWVKRIPLSLLSFFASAVALTADLLIPYLGADIVNYYFAGEKEGLSKLFSFIFKYAGEVSDLQLFGYIAIVFSAILLVRMIFIYIKNVSFQWNGLQMENDLRRITYEKLMSLDGETLSAYNTGELLSIMNRDVMLSKELYSRDMMNYFDGVLAIIISSVFLFNINPYLLIVPVVVSPLYIVFLIRYVKRIYLIFKNIRERYSDVVLTVQENIRGVRLVRAFSGENVENEKFDKVNSALFNANKEFDSQQPKYNALFEFFKQMSYVITIAISAFLVINGNMLVGSIAASTGYVLKIMGQISTVSQTTGAVQRHVVSMQKILHFVDTDGKILDLYPEARLYSPKPHIALTNVSLSLSENQILKNISLDIPYGKKVGIMGGTGSGKSVLLKSLARIFDVSSGEVSIDGKNVKDFSLDDLRREYAYVFQDVFLFSHTIDSNIAFYDDKVEMTEVERAAFMAQASGFIEKLDEGYQTIIGERGIGLSGGQKQRISIARALIKNAPVLILDDASSALDMATEKKVLDGIKSSYPEKTLIIAAHRVSSVADCDEIIYLQDGEIIERGTLDQLIKLGGKVASIYALQTSDGQLDDSSYGASEIEKEGGSLGN